VPPAKKEFNAEDFAKPPHLTKEEVLEVKVNNETMISKHLTFLMEMAQGQLIHKN
jgi:hypothetical protein